MPTECESETEARAQPISFTQEEVQVQAFVFRKLAGHLRLRSDVQNIEVMNLAGFCRNCLAKWYYAGARALGRPVLYEDACNVVYGMPYAKWKKHHQTKATPEQLARFEATKASHAKHDPIDSGASAARTLPPQPPPETKPVRPQGLLSDACCEDPDALARTDATLARAAASLKSRSVGDVVEVRLGVLTVSDRASRGEYPDASGPVIENQLLDFAERSGAFRCEVKRSAVVSDDASVIESTLREWSTAPSDEANACVNLILTTGGTGLSPRDVTPEATIAVVDRLVPGIPEAVRRETAKFEPLAMLSRAVAGIAGRTLIVNLPGRPKAVRESLSVILPVLSVAVREVEKGNGPCSQR